MMTTDGPGHGLEKYVWTDADFDRMGWHDCYIHAFHSGLRPERGEFDFLLDLDYIVRWLAPQSPETVFSFDIAPATLVFHHAHSITVRLAPGNGEVVTDGVRRNAERLTPQGSIKEYQ